MGILFVPSLVEKKFLTISDIDLDEANLYLEAFDSYIRNNRKLGAGSDADSIISMNLYYNVVDFDYTFEEVCEYDASEVELADAISQDVRISTLPGKRGARAVFVDRKDNIVGVGTTVIYNRNWASLGVDDSTVLTTLKARFTDDIDEVDDADDEISDDVGQWKWWVRDTFKYVT